MEQDKKLEETVSAYTELAKENPKIDVAALMLNALQKPDQNLVNPKSKKWAYIISAATPPFGLLFAIKYYLASEDDAKEVANICIILTILSLLGLYLFSKTIFSGSGINPEQLQQIKPQDVLELTK